MITIPGKIPISIHPFFWVIAALIGFFNSGTVGGIFLWILIILISVLFHEYGHALTAYFFGEHPRIELIPLGGRTSYEGKNLKFWQQFIIVLNGPLCGILLFVIATVLLKLKLFSHPFILSFLGLMQLVNLFWTVVNLLPVLPLDGGQLVRIALESFFGIKGFKAALFIGMIVAFGISFYFFLVQSFLIGALFFLFAFQSFDVFRKSKYITQSDRKPEYAEEFQQAEKALQEERVEDAKKLFGLIREQTQKGVLFVAATQYLALILYEEGNRKEAYELLLSIQDFVEERVICIFHELAFEEKNYPLVASLSSRCFQQSSIQDVALRNARAFAKLKKAKPAGGWLSTALQYEKLDIDKVLSEDYFQDVREDPIFQSFIKKK